MLAVRWNKNLRSFLSVPSAFYLSHASSYSVILTHYTSSQALRTISRLVTPAVETQVQKILRSAPAVCTPPSTTLRPLSANVVTSHVNLYTNPLRMCAKMAQPPKKPSLLSGAMADIKYGVSQSFKRLFAPRGSSGAHKLLAGLNRFDPLLQFNPQAIWRLQTFYRSYITLGVSLMSTLLYFSSVLGTPDSTMRLSLVPIRFWDGDYERLFTSPFLHTSLFHLLTVSGFFLAFSTAVEVAAGPVALISVLASCAIAGGAAALCAPERRPKYVFARYLPCLTLASVIKCYELCSFLHF